MFHFIVLHETYKSPSPVDQVAFFVIGLAALVKSRRLEGAPCEVLIVVNDRIETVHGKSEFDAFGKRTVRWICENSISHVETCCGQSLGWQLLVSWVNARFLVIGIDRNSHEDILTRATFAMNQNVCSCLRTTFIMSLGTYPKSAV